MKPREDDWDIPPAPPWQEPPPAGSDYWGSDKVLLEEQQATYEMQCQEKDRQYQEEMRQWPRWRVELIKTRIKLLRRYRKKPAAEPRRNLRDCVYLFWCPSLAVYKIGHTNNLERRIGDVRRELEDPGIVWRERYRTPVFRRLLEMGLHVHFRHGHFPSDKSDELFKLTQEEADGFVATTVKIERYLLGVEIFHLKTRLSQVEAELREAELREAELREAELRSVTRPDTFPDLFDDYLN